MKKSEFVQRVPLLEKGVIAECGRKLWYTSRTEYNL